MTHDARNWFAACCLLLAAASALAQEKVIIGIQAYRPKALVQAQWAPLAPALDQAIPGYHFIVEAYTVDELTEAIASRRIDFILTNPSQFVLLNHQFGLSAPLLSLSNFRQGKPVTSFGGVIFTRAERTDIHDLEDVRGKSVAAISTNSFGGYQMQAYELHQSGLSLPQDIRLIVTKPPQDNVVNAVLSGQTEIGFVRSGLLEDMASEGKLDLARIRVIHQRNLPGFPDYVSTRLYPEWMFAAQPHTNRVLERKLVSFLLNIAESKALTQALGIHGFDVPSDYGSVEDMLAELRMPPFDLEAAFSLRDVWEKYRLAISIATLAAGLLLLLGFRLLLVNHRLKIEKDLVQVQTDKLKESNNLLDSIVNNIPVMIFLKQVPDMRFVLLNRAGEMLLGRRRDEMIGRSDHDFFPKEQADFFIGKDKQVLQQMDVVDIAEEPIETSRGTRILHTKKLALRDGQDQPQFLLGISEDITERKRLEAITKRFEAIVQSSTDAITSKTMDGIITSWNPGAEAIFGYKAEEMIGQPMTKLFPAELIDEEARILARIASGESVDHIETVRINKNGEPIDVSVTISPIHDENGRITGASNVARDISERKLAEKELKRSNAELEQFSYAISHDMRQPLRMISSYLQLIEMGIGHQFDDEQRSNFHYAIDGAHRLDKMLVGLLEYSRVGRLGEPPEWIESRELLDEALRFLQPAIAEAQAELHINGEWPRVFVSRDELMRLIQNLVGNAVKYRIAGRTPEITVNSEMAGNEWRFSVADNGVGIHPDQIGRLFQVFQRLQSRAAYEGTGLGLALCRKIVEHHGGRIVAESAGENQGSCFRVYIPIRQDVSLESHVGEC